MAKKKSPSPLTEEKPESSQVSLPPDSLLKLYSTMGQEAIGCLLGLTPHPNWPKWKWGRQGITYAYLQAPGWTEETFEELRQKLKIPGLRCKFGESSFSWRISAILFIYEDAKYS